MQKEKIKRDSMSSSRALSIGLALIAPLFLLMIYTHFLPLTGLFSTAMTDGNFLSDPQFIGVENFTQLAEDQRFIQSIVNTLPFVIQRAIIAVIIPLLIGGLIGTQAKTGRLINRVLLGILAGLIAPMALTIIWAAYFAPQWGLEPSPIFNDDFSLMDPNSALSVLRLLDALLITATATVVGGTVFIAVMRGQSRAMTGIAVGLIGLIVAGASGWMIFDLPFVLTAGGPVGSTTTLMLNVYNEGFQFFDIGYASAQVASFAIGAMIVGLLIGVITIGFNLRITQINPNIESGSGNNKLSLASIPIIVLTILSLGGYLVWALSIASQFGGQGGSLDDIPLAQGFFNSLSPLFAVWFIHLPLTFMAGIGLGFYRPFGKIGSNILFIIMLMITLIPTEALIFEWFLGASETGMLDNISMIGFPWMVNGFTLLVFKLFADGARDHYYASLEAGMSNTKAFGKHVFQSGLWLVITAGVVLSFISIQSIIWPLISQNSSENYTVSILLFIMRNTTFEAPATLLNASVTVLLVYGVPFIVMFVLIQIFILERFALDSGEPVTDYTDFEPTT